MALRYSLRALSPHDESDLLLDEINNHRQSMRSALVADEFQVPWSEVVEHLKRLGAKTLLIQRKVLDPDFLEEHQAFYAKQHRDVSRKCTRVHAFKIECPPELPEEATETDRVKEILEFVEKAAQVSDAYLGYVTVRPLRHAPVGATVLPPEAGAQLTVVDAFPMYIAGSRFEVTGAPFLQQDSAVGACAQASMWMALRAMRRRHGNAAYSPAELTAAATRYLAVDRAYPGRGGLTIGQMLDTVRFAGHDPLHIRLRDPLTPATPAEEVIRMATPYIDSGMPVLCVLTATGGGHVVVALGLKPVKTKVFNVQDEAKTQGNGTLKFEPASNWIRGFIIHNDAQGPYSRLLSKASDGTADYVLEDTCSLVVTLPDGVYTNAKEAQLLAVKCLNWGMSILFAQAQLPAVDAPEVKVVLRPILCSRNGFRQWARSDPNLDEVVRERYRTYELPPNVWVVEVHDAAIYDPTDPKAQSRYGEIVLDASADPQHADSHIFTSVLSDLWPSKAATLLAGVFIAESDDSEGALDCFTIDAGQPGTRILEPWAD